MAPESPAASASKLFDGGRLALARELTGLNKSQLARDIGTSPASVTGWEQGNKNPSPANVAQLALRLTVAPDFFITRGSETSNHISTPHFRSLRSTPQISRAQGKRFAQMVRDGVEGLSRYVDFPTVSFPAYPVDLDDTESDEPESAALKLREQWDLGASPLPHAIRTVEQFGAIAVYSPDYPSAIDAFSISGEARPLIILNPQKNDYYRQRFDLSHELGHLIMHSEADPGNKVAENQADRFAAEFLLPTDAIYAKLPSRMNNTAWTDLKELKEEWGVSIQALLYRARYLGKMNENSYRNAMITITKRGWRRSEPGNRTILEQPSSLPKALELLTENGYRQDLLAKEFGIPLEVFRIITSRTPLFPGTS